MVKFAFSHEAHFVSAPTDAVSDCASVAVGHNTIFTALQIPETPNADASMPQWVKVKFYLAYK